MVRRWAARPACSAFLVGVLAVVSVRLPIDSTGAAPASAWRGSVEDLVASQRLLEGVRWGHRIWPAENPQPKPPLSSVLGDDVLRDRVDDGLRKARALEAIWGQPITHEDIQAELDRMARNSKDAARLAEVWTALGNDPARIGETMIRPLLADRRIRELYASDTRFHGALKSKAIAAMRGVATAADLRGSGGTFVETTYHVAKETEWNRVLGDLSRAFAPGRGLPMRAVSRLIEDESGFRAFTILDRDASSVRVGTAVWAKTPFANWWSTVSATLSAAPFVPDGTLVLPSLDVVSSCTPGTWSAMDPDMPTGRSDHTAVSTGSEMLIWGGAEGAALQEGWRYDPSADTWTRMSDAGAPEARFQHLAFWSGTELLIVNGYNGVANNEGLGVRGGRYNPTTDSWLPMTDVDAPPRTTATAGVWTGTRLILWGGSSPGDNLASNEGGRYDPATDTWTPTSLVNAPSARNSHTAIWTGGKMVIWGGGSWDPATQVTTYLKTGGVYDPASDTWSATRTDTAPSGRAGHTAVWTGTRMLIWGGASYDPASGVTTYYGDGRAYDPGLNQWSAMAASHSPSGRVGHSAVWSGSLMVVWGGYDDVGPVDGGGRYKPSNNSWQSVTSAGAPAARFSASAVWLAGRMVVWGGHDGYGPLDSGGRYDPAKNKWTPTKKSSTRPPPRTDHSAVWTGSEMIVMGGIANPIDGPYDAFRYDPSTDTWQATATTPLQDKTTNAPAVWTGTQVLVWGGLPAIAHSFCVASGLRYDPNLDAWSPMTSLAAPVARCHHSAVWTGTRFVVWGGQSGDRPGYFNTGGRYDPSADAWTSTSTEGAPTPRSLHTAVWSGRRMIVWGGFGLGDPDGGNKRSGGQYDPLEDTWASTSTSGAPSPRQDQSAVWSGSSMLVWGGSELRDGSRFDPAADTWLPMATSNAPPSGVQSVMTCGKMASWGADFETNGGVYDLGANAWTPTAAPPHPGINHHYFPLIATEHQMIVWGGWGQLNPTNTGATYCVCTSQPAPGNVRAFVDKAGGSERIAWEADPYAAGYDLIRGSLTALRSSHGDFTAATSVCLANDSPLTWYDDSGPPLSGGSWYLVRALSPAGVGSYDDGSTSETAPRDPEIELSPSACP